MSTEITKEMSLKLEIVSITDMLEETEELLSKISDDIHTKIHEDIFPLIDNICSNGSL